MYDRHESPSYNLTENGIRMAFYSYIEYKDKEEETITFLPLTPDLGSYILTQNYPCAEGDAECSASVIPYQERNYVL